MLHHPGWGHPECPERFAAIRDHLLAGGIPAGFLEIPVRAATREELELAHDPSYLDLARHEIEYGVETLSTGDTQVGPESWHAAIHAVGGILNAVDAIVAGHIRTAFCAVRPPGHHATGSKGMGFCILNNIAIAARYAIRRHGFERVLIVDWDVHHGNGTQDIFYKDSNVFYFSIHEAPLYPYTGWEAETGSGPGLGFTMNVPLPAGTSGTEVIDIFRNRLRPAMEKFRPEIVMISAGFDSRKGDPLGSLRLDDDDFARMTGVLLEIAGRHSAGRVLSVLEGGYNLAGLSSAVGAHVSALARPDFLNSLPEEI